MIDEADFKTPFRTIGIIGIGLMGGSFGKAILSRTKDVNVIGFDKDAKALDTAISTGCISQSAQSLSELAELSDLIVLATPVRTYEKILRDIPSETWDKTWLTDLGSVKGQPHIIVKSVLPAHAIYVGGHPMAGSEKVGCENGNKDLFAGAAFYLTSDKPEWIAPIKNLVSALGADPKIIDPQDHDRIVSVSSHVPHVTASLLVSILHEDIAINETGGGYQDTTRIAGSDPVMWTDIFISNKTEVLKALDELHNELHKVIAMIDKEDSEAIYKFLETTRDKRLGGKEHHGDHNRRKAI